MANPRAKRFSQYDAAAPLSGAEQLLLLQNEHVKITPLNNIKQFTDTSCQCTLASRYTESGTGNNTLKTYLHTYTLPANTLSTDGSWLDIFAAGYFAANGNNKLVAIGIASTATGLDGNHGTPNFAFNDDFWEIALRVQRINSDSFMVTKKVTVVANSASLGTPGMFQTITDVGTFSGLWLNDVQLSVNATNGTASADDITCSSFIVVAHLLDTNS